MPCNCRQGTGSHDHLRDGFVREGIFGIGSPINEQVDLPFLQLWNSRHNASEARRIFDPTMEDNQDSICSDADPELLFLVPLKQVCRIRGISISGTNDDFAPSQVKLFCNPTDVVGFDSVRRLQPREELQLAQVPAGDRIVYRLNPGKFSSCSTLGLFFENSFGGDETHLLRIDIFGESTGRSVHQQLATNIVYEAQANPADHKVDEEYRKTFTERKRIFELTKEMIKRPEGTLLHEPSCPKEIKHELTLNGPTQSAKQIFEPDAAVLDPQLSEAVSLGTTIMAVSYKGGVVLAADSRTSTGTYVVNRASNKLTKLTEKIYCCRSGSAADTQALAEQTANYLENYETDTSRPVNVVSAANIFQKLCYMNKWNISAGIIVAGYDALNGGCVYSIPSGGSCVKLDYALGGSGSIFLYSFFDANYKPGMTKEECIRFCQRAVAHAYSRDGSSGGLIRTIALHEGKPEDVTVPWTKTPYCMEKDPKYNELAVQNPPFSSSAKISVNQTQSARI